MVILAKTISTIRNYRMIEQGDNVIVGVSGGADSVTLLSIIKGLQKEYELDIVVVHINHKMRGLESDEDENFVRQLCEKEGISFKSYACDIQQLAKTMKISDEEAGRYYRYKVFEENFIAGRNNKIAVGHNGDDQAETMIMRFFRGCGIKGLTGIPAVRENIIRPLIECTREEIEQYCSENSLEYRVDSTNRESVYTRNKIRNVFIPMVEENINKNVKKTLRDMSHQFQEEEDFLDKYSNEKFNDIKLFEDDNKIGLKFCEFCQQDQAIKKRILRIGFKKINGNLKDFTYVHIENILKCIDGGTGKSVNLPNGIVFKCGSSSLSFEKNMAIEHGFDYILKMEDIKYIPEKKYYVSLSTEEDKFSKKFINLCTKSFSYDKIETDIHFRTRKPSDKIYLEKINGSKKIKNYFIDTKTPKNLRDTIPLLACENNILWVLDEKNFTNSLFVDEGVGERIYVQLWNIIE